jgi:nucleotide-binding universal stress UspA family protein
MKILIAYDGSAGADIAIDGLRRAGLPGEGVDALVVSVAEVWLPPPPRDGAPEETFPTAPGLEQAREYAQSIMTSAEELAERGAKRVRSVCPGWNVSPRVTSGSPAFELLNSAQEWQPQLIVVGSYGRTALGRFVLGSVSQKVLTEAPTSVRVGRQSIGIGNSAQRIIVGVDGSPGSHAAVTAVAERKWTPGSEVRVIVAEDLMKAFPVSLLVSPVRSFVDETNAEEHTQAEKMATEALKQLRAGLDQNVTLSSVVDSGDPKQVLIRHAEEFGADCIFTGATGFSNRIERFVLGSVSAAVAARAQCSVEVVRALPQTT